MPKRITLLKSLLLLALPLVLLLPACGTERPRIALPPAERAAEVAYPPIPTGEAVCDGKPCLSDRETAGVIAGLANALDEANRRLSWLRDWITTAGK
jgi:hypothetical protein